MLSLYKFNFLKPIKNGSKIEVLLPFLKSLNYISIETLTEIGFTVNETEKKLMREREKSETSRF